MRQRLLQYRSIHINNQCEQTKMRRRKKKNTMLTIRYKMLFFRENLVQLCSCSTSDLQLLLKPLMNRNMDLANGKGKERFDEGRSHHTILILCILLTVPLVTIQFLRENYLYFSTASTNITHVHRSGSEMNSTKKEDSPSLLLHNDPNNRIIGQHDHIIPTVLTFTHRYNLLTEVFPYGQNVRDNYESLSAEEREMLALQENVRDIIATHPESTVRFLKDDDCSVSIQNVMKMLYNNSEDISNEMVEYFVNEPEGMFKGDLCRGTALYETGGLYFDVDLAIRMSLWNVIKSTTEFVTVNTDEDSPDKGFFQAFIGVTQAHPVIGRYVTLFYEYYKKTLPRRDEIEGRLLGVLLLKRAYDEIELDQQENQGQELIKLGAMKQLGNHNSDSSTSWIYGLRNRNPTNVSTESVASKSRIRGAETKYDDHRQAGEADSASSEISNNNSNIVARTHLNRTSELWYEMEYDKRLNAPFPTWGRSRNCKIVVATEKLSKSESAEMGAGNDNKIIVPFYSRIANSRMCPILTYEERIAITRLNHKERFGQRNRWAYSNVNKNEDRNMKEESTMLSKNFRRWNGNHYISNARRNYRYVADRPRQVT